MKSILTIKDLSVSKELDRTAMSVVRGGLDNQGNANQQLTSQFSMINNSIANGSYFNGPTVIQADVDVDQHSENYAYNENYKALELFRNF
jgi:hypothetical protein